MEAGRHLHSWLFCAHHCSRTEPDPSVNPLQEKKEYQVFIEKEVLKRLNYVGVITLFTQFQDKDNLYFVIEFVDNGNFKNYVERNCIGLLFPPTY